MLEETHKFTLRSAYYKHLGAFGLAHCASAFLIGTSYNSGIMLQIYPFLPDGGFSFKDNVKAIQEEMRQTRYGIEGPKYREVVTELTCLEDTRASNAGTKFVIAMELGTLALRTGLRFLLTNYLGYDDYPVLADTAAGFLFYPLHALHISAIQRQCQGQLNSHHLCLFSLSGAAAFAVAQGMESALYYDYIITSCSGIFGSFLSSDRNKLFLSALLRSVAAGITVPLWTLAHAMTARNNYRVYLAKEGTEEEREKEKEMWGDGSVLDIARVYIRQCTDVGLLRGAPHMILGACMKAMLVPTLVSMLERRM
eukprot:gb/GECH01013979.1/.p1 GENE.gb/GECH01013979.1/~~gb/GECH01013979.1/.p1  ORF type:complete len:310 (+),score=14.46 gb/GECH01013979.1/:1-930(+)